MPLNENSDDPYSPGAHALTCRPPAVADAPGVWKLIKESPPLDLNSPYNYMLLCTHFARTCVVCEEEGRLAGFLSAYVRPDDPATLFVWQAVVSADFRKRGVATKMVDALLAREGLEKVRYLETTIGPSNDASRRLFMKTAERLDAPVSHRVLFPADLFGGGDHEDEVLYRVGPFEKKTK